MISGQLSPDYSNSFRYLKVAWKICWQPKKGDHVLAQIDIVQFIALPFAFPGIVIYREQRGKFTEKRVACAECFDTLDSRYEWLKLQLAVRSHVLSYLEDRKFRRRTGSYQLETLPLLKITCVVSVSARVLRQRWDESKKEESKGRVIMIRRSFSFSPPPFLSLTPTFAQ